MSIRIADLNLPDPNDPNLVVMFVVSMYVDGTVTVHTKTHPKCSKERVQEATDDIMKALSKKSGKRVALGVYSLATSGIVAAITKIVVEEEGSYTEIPDPSSGLPK